SASASAATYGSSSPTDRGIESLVGPFLALPLDCQEFPVLIEDLPVELLLSGQPEDARKVRLEVRASRVSAGSSHASLVVCDDFGSRVLQARCARACGICDGSSARALSTR